MESETAKIACRIRALQERVANTHDMLEKILNLIDSLNKRIADLEKAKNDNE